MKDSDRELLELAAKAAQLPIEWEGSWNYQPDWPRIECEAWNPLERDGDAFRLAVTLRIELRFHSSEVEATVEESYFERSIVTLPISGDQFRDARELIVRAAAEIARLEQ